jgi:hypothetical protein
MRRLRSRFLGSEADRLYEGDSAPAKLILNGNDADFPRLRS